MKDLPEGRDEAERFNSDLDSLQAGRPVISTSDDAHKADLELARLLHQTWFAPSRGFEFRLRNQLLNQLDKKEAKKMSLSRLFRAVARPVLVATLATVLLFGVALAVSPDVRAGAGGWVARFVEVDSPSGLLAQHPSPVLDVPAGSDASLQPERSSGETLPPLSPALAVRGDSAESLPQPAAAEAKVEASRDLVSLETAQASLSFKIRVPGRLPDGYKLLGAVRQPSLNAPVGPAPALRPNLPKVPADAPKIEPPQMVNLIFGDSSDGKLMLSELRVVNSGDLEASLPAGKGSVKEVTVNGQPAQYIEGAWSKDGWVANGEHQLHWQDAEGVLYDLLSSNLGLEELLAVAESLK